MRFIKIKISLQERLTFLLFSIESLATTTIPVHRAEDGGWYEDRLSFIERWEDFLSCLETAIIGYVYGLEE